MGRIESETAAEEIDKALREPVSKSEHVEHGAFAVLGVILSGTERTGTLDTEVIGEDLFLKRIAVASTGAAADEPQGLLDHIFIMKDAARGLVVFFSSDAFQSQFYVFRGKGGVGIK